MGWNIFEEGPKNQLTKAFSSKYTLTVDTDVVAGSITMKSKAEMRWQVDVKNIREALADINIITLHHRMLESSHPMITDIAGISSTFGGMYSELELTVNEKGNIVKIRNLETIRKKWQWVKQDMEKLLEENQALKGMISLNDELFSSDKKMAAAIEANEFFNVYFHPFWGKPLPSDRSGIEKNNLLNTHTMKWGYNGHCNPDYNPSGTAPMQLGIAGYRETDTNKNWLQQAYGAFEHLPLQGLKPKFEDQASYHITPYGKVLKAVVEKSEVMHPALLYMKYRYELTAEEEAETAKPVQQPQQERKRPPHWENMIVDTKNL
jgi:hypothetical protein